MARPPALFEKFAAADTALNSWKARAQSAEALLADARSLCDSIGSARRRLGAISTHAQQMSWRISELIGPRQVPAEKD